MYLSRMVTFATIQKSTVLNCIQSKDKKQGDSQVLTTGKLRQTAYNRELFKKAIKHNSKFLDKYFVQIYI